jgi:hypothetical protein
MKKNRSYADDWNEYVKNFTEYAKKEPTNKGRTDLIYPGDEWGTPETWSAFADKFLNPFLPKDGTGIAVEIGQGAGKYTLQVIDNVQQIICLDVSDEFIKLAAGRLSQHVKDGKVHFRTLNLSNCNEIIHTLKEFDIVGKVDLFFSIDSMVHVELHTLIAYFINIAKSLKIGGHMTMGVASCANDYGFQRLLDETAWCYGGMRPSHQFYFLSKDIVYFIADKLGFEIVLYDEKRDINFVARKIKELPIDLKEL